MQTHVGLGSALRGAGSAFSGNLCVVPGKTFVAYRGLPKPTGSGRVTSRLSDSQQFLRLSSVVILAVHGFLPVARAVAKEFLQRME